MLKNLLGKATDFGRHLRTRTLLYLSMQIDIHKLFSIHLAYLERYTILVIEASLLYPRKQYNKNP